MTTSEPHTPSQPDSLDLDYDNWQGQFDFVGTKAQQNGDENESRNSQDDLTFDPPEYDPNQRIFLDEDTFLSLQPSDLIDNSGPHSGLFIDEPEPYFRNIEDINNAKNNYNRRSKMPDKMMNGIKAEFCDTLTEQLELLQKQVTNLADTQNIVEDRTTRTKTEYAVLQARYHMLEEQLRESELRSDERLTEEQKRHRELLARVEREAQLQNENCQIKIKTIELECASLKDDVQRLRVQCDKQAADLHTTEEKLEIARENVQIAIQDLQEAHLSEKRLMVEKKQSDELMVELGKEIERLRLEKGPALPTTSPETLRLEELHTELEELRGKNKQLEETNDELQALVLTRGVEEGRNLLNGTSNSLAKELEEMDQNQDNVENAAASLASLSQLQVVYQEKEEENLRLKNYIDTILVNIVENYPQLLEVKTNY